MILMTIGPEVKILPCECGGKNCTEFAVMLDWRDIGYPHPWVLDSFSWN